MTAQENERTEWREVKTRLRVEQAQYLERLAAAEERSIASILRRLVREAMQRDAEVAA